MAQCMHLLFGMNANIQPREGKDMNTTQKPHCIVGCPRDKWEEVQAIQHESFVWVQYGGASSDREDNGTLDGLKHMLETYPLRRDFEPYGNFIQVDPCRGIHNPDWSYLDEDTYKPKWIDGPRLYACGGVTMFNGNFFTYSHAFCVVTNHQLTIDLLTHLIRVNQQRPDYLAQDEPQG